MTDIISLPPGVVLDPFWDMAPDGIALPLWLGILVFLLIVVFVRNFWWIYKYLIMRPVQGHGIAARSGNEKTQQVLMFGLNRAFSIQALEYTEKVLAFKDTSRIARWLQTSPYATGMLGYKSIMLVSEIFDQPKDPLAEMAIGVACRKHNASVSEMDDMIVNYSSYRDNRIKLEHENPDGVDIPIYSLWDPGLIYQYTPEKRTAGQWGRTVLKDAGDLNISQPQLTTWQKYAPILICLIFGVIAIVLVGYFTGSAGSAQAAASSVIPFPTVAPTMGV